MLIEHPSKCEIEYHDLYEASVWKRSSQSVLTPSLSLCYSHSRLVPDFIIYAAAVGEAVVH